MFTPQGNCLVAKMIQELKADLVNLSLLEVRKKLIQRTKAIALNHAEIYDSEVRNAIYYELTEKAKQLHGWSFSLHTKFWEV